jgi:hypothetical protein
MISRPRRQDLIPVNRPREALNKFRVRDGGDFRAGRDSGRRRVLDVREAADGDAMREPRRRLRLRASRGAREERSRKRLRCSPRPSRRRGRWAGDHGKGLAAFGLRPEVLDVSRTIL